MNLEFVSANPTGPLHAGGGRWVAVGDAIANLLAAQGAEVHREYYLNDAGNQLDTFRDSLLRAVPRRAAAGRRLPGRSTSSRWPSELRAELGDDVTPDDACEWGCGRGRRRHPRRPRPHRRALRHVVLRAHAARARRRRPTCCACSTNAGSRSKHDGARWLRIDRLRRLARPRARAQPTASPRTSATTSRTTATSSRAASRTSSTSGAPTTTAR